MIDHPVAHLVQRVVQLPVVGKAEGLMDRRGDDRGGGSASAGFHQVDGRASQVVVDERELLLQKDTQEMVDPVRLVECRHDELLGSVQLARILPAAALVADEEHAQDPFVPEGVVVSPGAGHGPGRCAGSGRRRRSTSSSFLTRCSLTQLVYSLDSVSQDSIPPGVSISYRLRFGPGADSLTFHDGVCGSHERVAGDRGIQAHVFERLHVGHPAHEGPQVVVLPLVDRGGNTVRPRPRPGRPSIAPSRSRDLLQRAPDDAVRAAGHDEVFDPADGTRSHAARETETGPRTGTLTPKTASRIAHTNAPPAASIHSS